MVTEPYPPRGRKAFQKLVDEAVDSLPDRFFSYLENVVIAVEDRPDPELLEELGADDLLGVYMGVPLTERQAGGAYMPDQILLFRKPLLEVCGNLQELRTQIRITVVHEVGHFFGLNEQEIVEILGE